MPNIIARNPDAKKAIVELGKMIADIRKLNMSQSQLAKQVGLSRSNMKYIEDGINAPTPDIYKKIISTLNPENGQKKEMDNLFMKIRRIPPPDVNDTIMRNKTLVLALQKINDCRLNKEQIDKISAVFSDVASTAERI